MKRYVKPAMMALSISANDMLCSGACEVKTRDSTDSFIQKLNEMFGAGGKDDGIFDPEDKVFGKETDCNPEKIFDKYCKYTASDDGLFQLFTS